MYGSGGAGTSGLSATEGLDSIAIDLIPDETGVYLRNLLIDRFYQNGYPVDPRYRLRVATINQKVQDLDITTDSESTRRQIILTTDMNLVDIASGENVLSRPVKAITSYNVLGSQFTTRVSENDAREAALEDMARQIETQIALFLKR
jgi:LPS-assembly lipoprotein